MDRIKAQNVRGALGGLEKDPSYQSFVASGLDQSFNRFRQEVEITGIRCLVTEPEEATLDEIEERLGELRECCVGTLAKFRPFIERAQAALHGA